MDVYFTYRSASLAELRTQVQWWEQHNATGVLIPDHLFVAGGDTPRSQARRGSDPLVLLSAVATL
jgi:alkanesulfonate monooxygenase SsuD/methylene tetrahydromethanopterin reductase-like flavin-dependent oxidoreductase (luciferase family)